MISIIEKILLLFFIALVVALAILYNQNQKLRENNIRLAENQSQVIDENVHWQRLVLSQGEFNKLLTHKVDSLLKSLKIAPKQVERVIERHHYHTDTIVKYYELPKVGNSYPFIDTAQCFKFGGEVNVLGDKVNLLVNLREYNNETTDIFYRERPHKFLFFKWGKWQYEHQAINKCGTDEVREIEIKRK